MNKINKDQIRIVRAYRKCGYSYKEIAKLLSLSPATIYKYASHIELNSKAKNRLALKIKNNISNFVNLWSKPKEIRVIRSLNKPLTRIISHCLFDGCVISYRGNYIIKYTNSSREEVKQFVKDFYSVFNIKPQIVYKYKGVNLEIYECIFISKKAVEFLRGYIKNYSTSNENSSLDKLTPLLKTDALKIEFLRCFWCDEGCIDARNQIHGKSKSLRIIKQLKHLHNAFDIGTSIWRDNTSEVYALYIKKSKENLKRFSEIGFGNGVVAKGYNIGLKKESLFKNVLER